MTRRSSPSALVLILCLGGLARADGDPAAPPGAGTGAVGSAVPTWHEAVEPIVQRRCQVCHREGQAAPFALQTREQAAEWADTIAEVVRERRMPPWHADPAIGRFANDRHLDDAEQATILAWLAGGLPAGDPGKAPPAPTWPESGWHIGQPDAVLSMPRSVKIPATGVLQYQYFDVGTDFGEDRWVDALEVRVGAPAVVHHVLIFIKFPDNSQPNMKGGLKGYFASGLPGDTVLPFPPGLAKRLPRGSRLIFQMHYTPNGTPAEDRTELGLRFAPSGEARREMRTVSVFETDFRIPPHAAAHEVAAETRFKEDTILYSFLPHMHVRGKSFKYVLRTPDGKEEVLLSVPRYDFNWQNSYRLAEPRFLPAGSKVTGHAFYDNSDQNPANPDPSRDVGFGEQTWDEMMIGYMDVTTATPEERAAWEAAGKK